MKLLIVDDNDEVLQIMVQIFVWAGYEVSSASGPREALEIFRRDPGITRVFSDVQMPVMNGWQLYEAMAPELEARGGKFAVHSGNPDPDLMLRFQQRQVPFYLKGKRLPPDIFASPS